MSKLYRVNGMSCDGCAKSVTNAITAAAPGAKVSVDLEAKTVAVENCDAADVVRQAVEDAGFDFAGAA